MVDIHEQKTFDFITEENDIVLVNKLDHPLVKAIDKQMDGLLQNNFDKPFTTVHTLGKMVAKKLHIVNKTDLEKPDKREEIYKQIAKLKGDLCVLIDTFEINDYLEIVQDLSEHILTNNYVFNTFKNDKKTDDKNFYYYGETAIYRNVLKGYVYGEMMNKCRDLVNTPYNHLNAIDLANYAKALETYDNVTVTIYDKKQIEDMNMGSYLGVNKGSSDEPRLIFIEYKGSTTKEPVALVGKGVMYDTGGYSIKTSTGMPGMKVDMAGAAAVISAIEAIAKLKLDAHVMSIVAATDNRIGDGAIVPDDILTAANGKTIEIISTDAEGRLTLADAVWFAQQQGAKKVIDVATLTGSMVRALGKEYTGAFTNDNEFLQELMDASNKTKEPLWEMPINKGYHKLLESKFADMKNTGGPLAGASTAAAFIENFIDEDTKWIHLDIAGTASNKANEGTGVMVKTFTELFDN
ncbi:M17 family metallopeptidase [Candidatus Xianfuyuplasma coldseepsis]|uniref:Probable cytosol aminopeptidase n=1 Tax=Candidatus Xianfuyuplasma coldseepsis TaxID=2782163 RepID=A0A7L7KRR1_9MOLU|nr:leucyl aminopeptidase [Xianfuyuplasma coldseepsis]QMS84952.1 leucyl aminopeptidase [Xianfuyuplasma coldseepsis]